jgi:hypothetical protein
MTQERKTERVGPVTMRDENGNSYAVFCDVTSQRSWFLDGRWSDWTEESKRFFTGESHVNPPDSEGWWEMVTSGIRIRP